MRNRLLPLVPILVLAAALAPSPAAATVVRFTTVMGNFDVEIFDQATPLTAANFLAYQSSGAYTNTMIHRAAVIPVPFVIQGGGWRFDGSAQVEPANYPLVAPLEPILNEPGLSNVRGTIAMAKGADPNSARNQWYFNLANNGGPAPSLDTENGGFTVFGRVLGNGMSVVDAISDLEIFQFLAGWEEAPMRNYTVEEYNAFVPVDGDNVVIINSIVVLPDVDGDLVLDDGDGDGTAGSTRCATGQSAGCDDNCPTVANATQTDTGGFASAVPDGFGNACQCGEVSGDGNVSILDAALMARVLNVPGATLPAPGRCPASLGAVCDSANLTRVRRGLAGLLTPGPYGCLVGI